MNKHKQGGMGVPPMRTARMAVPRRSGNLENESPPSVTSFEKRLVNIMSTQTIPTLSTVKRLLDEVDEYYRRVRKAREKLRGHRAGSEGYLDLLPDLEVELEVLKAKVEHAHQALEEFEESLRESD